MSTSETHETLKAKVGWHSDVAGVTVFDAEGMLINSSAHWPPPDINIADRAYFKAAQSGAAAAPVSIELVQGRFSKDWVTVIAHKITGPNGEFLGLVTRAIRPASFENSSHRWRWETVPRLQYSIATERCWDAIRMFRR